MGWISMKIIDDIKTNWSAKSSKIGVIFHKWVAGFLFLLVSLSAYVFYNKYKEEKEQKEGVEQLFSKQQTETQIYKNKYGQIVSRTAGLILENKTIKQLVKDGNLSFLKEFQ